MEFCEQQGLSLDVNRLPESPCNQTNFKRLSNILSPVSITLGKLQRQDADKWCVY
jgi:hypothetical protein